MNVGARLGRIVHGGGQHTHGGRSGEFPWIVPHEDDFVGGEFHPLDDLAVTGR